MQQVVVQMVSKHRTYGSLKLREISVPYNDVVSLGSLGSAIDVPSGLQNTLSNVVGGILVSHEESVIPGTAWFKSYNDCSCCRYDTMHEVSCIENADSSGPSVTPLSEDITLCGCWCVIVGTPSAEDISESSLTVLLLRSLPSTLNLSSGSISVINDPI
jgi:hypothetical protein